MQLLKCLAAVDGDDDAIKGMSRVLAEVIDELYEASKLLDAETGNE